MGTEPIFINSYQLIPVSWPK